MAEESYVVERALVVHAHPDDAEFACAGLVAHLTSQGTEVNYLICTAGNRGGEGDRTEAELQQVRVAEQRAAADVVGVGEVINLGYDDGSLTASLDVRRDITRVLRQYRPQLVISPNAIRHYGAIGGNHPDHLATGEATLAAVYPTVRNPMALPELLAEGLPAWTVDWVYICGALERDINHYEDITDTIDLKVKALLCHQSQLGPEIDGWIRYQTAQTGAEATRKGMGEFKNAEAFVKMWVGEHVGRLQYDETTRLVGPRPAAAATAV